LRDGGFMMLTQLQMLFKLLNYGGLNVWSKQKAWEEKIHTNF